jgi:hypothetical protein
MGISPAVPKTLYNTANPQDEVSELYTIFADVLPDASDPQKRWVVNEKHGWWDEGGKQFLYAITTLSPTDPKHCVTIEEAHKIIDKQVLLRARSGFRYLFIKDFFDAPGGFRRFEIFPDGTQQEIA